MPECVAEPGGQPHPDQAFGVGVSGPCHVADDRQRNAVHARDVLNGQLVAADHLRVCRSEGQRLIFQAADRIGSPPLFSNCAWFCHASRSWSACSRFRMWSFYSTPDGRLMFEKKVAMCPLIDRPAEEREPCRA